MAALRQYVMDAVRDPQIMSLPEYGVTDFGQVRVAGPRRLLDLTQIDEINSDILSTAVVGAGSVTHKPLTSSAQLAVTGASGDKATIRSIYLWYTAGAAQRIKMTGWAQKLPQANQRIRIGYFDDDNGLFYEARSTGVYLVRRTNTSGVATDNEQLTGLTLSDVLSHSIYEITFRYLGHGPARFFFNVKQALIWDFAPEAAPFMQNARLPICIELENTGASVANKFDFQCASVESEGGSDETIPSRTFGSALSVASVPSAETGLLAFRLASTFNGLTNRGSMHSMMLTLGAETNRARFTVRWRPTLLLPNSDWAAVDATSRVQVRTLLTGANAPSALGIPLQIYFIASGGGQTFDISDLFHQSARMMQNNPLTGAQGVLMITGQNEGAGATADLVAGLSWSEHP